MRGNGLRSGVHACYGFCREGVKNPNRMQGKGLRGHLSRLPSSSCFFRYPLIPAGKSPADCVSIQTITTSSPDGRDGVMSRNETIIFNGSGRNPVFGTAAQTDDNLLSRLQK